MVKHDSPPSSPLQDFYFKPKKVSINWRLLSSVNVDEIWKSNNTQKLQPLIENITCGDILQGMNIKRARFRSKHGQIV